MDYYSKLYSIWGNEIINGLPAFVKDRRFVFCENENQKDILITGINPSFNEKAPPQEPKYLFEESINAKHNYWSSLKRILISVENNISLIDQCAYTDLFYFRERDQAKLRHEIIKSPIGLNFLAAQLNITQHVIENKIKPKLILVKNKESAAYWGILSEKGIIWMGYEFEFLRSLPFGEIFKISGLSKSNERIAPEIKETNLKNSIIIFSKHINQYTKKEERPTALQLLDLLNEYKQNNSCW